MKILIFILLFISSAFAYSEEIKEDKYMHLGVSFGIGTVLNTYVVEDYKYAFTGCLLVGLTKELYDEYDYGGFDNKDMVANAVGCGASVWLSEQYNIDFLQIKTKNNWAGIEFNYPL